MISAITAALGNTIPVAVGMYEQEPYPDKFIVITPLWDSNDDIADDAPLTETQRADVNLYCRGNYVATKNAVQGLLSGFIMLERQYVEYQKDTKHHHYVFMIAKKEAV